ncbi:MAG: hypothetical protein OHK93_005326 [Ramalina farinacea]|uniref:F-box domain-containing protein n=1 Tax=Ramalina farinacea TaxID=258253 RepID=A0AA43QVU3_9LECA|nr:hypothetical protein [Ramalina farinacea]
MLRYSRSPSIKQDDQRLTTIQRRRKFTMVETNIEPDKPFPFLNLPTEIRIMIYDLLLAEYHVTQPDDLLTRATYKTKRNILVLNKQLYNETAPILDKTHIFSALTWLPRSSSRGNIPRTMPGCITFCKGTCVLPPGSV